MASLPINDVITEEVAALQAIMMDEVNVEYDQSGQPTSVAVVVKPATAQNIEKQHVRVTLIVNIPHLYPDESPNIILKNPRGIDDDVLQLIKTETVKKCEEFIGFPVIYELTELVREKLTANNAPSCSCAVCLFNFTQNDHFTKTSCFHYFHSNCLGRYIVNCEETAAAEEKENQQPSWITREKRQLQCPICRESLEDEQIDGAALLQMSPPEESKMMEDFCPTAPDVVALQEKMTSLYMHQKSKGGIIDLEEEKNKFLVSAAVNNFDNVEENDEDCVNETRQLSDSSSKDLPSKSYSHRMPNNVSNKRGGNVGSRNQNKRDNSYGQYWWSGRNKNSHRRGARSNHNVDNQIFTSNTPAARPYNDDKFSSNYRQQNQVEKNDKGRNVELKMSDTGNTAKYEPRMDDRSLRGGIGVERVSGEPKKLGRGQSYRNSTFRGGRGKGRGSPPGFAELDRPVSTHATS